MESTVRKQVGTNVGGLTIFSCEIGPFTWERDPDAQEPGVIIKYATDEDVNEIFNTSELPPHGDDPDPEDATDEDIIDIFKEGGDGGDEG